MTIVSTAIAERPRDLILSGIGFDILWIKPTQISGVTLTDAAGKLASVPAMTLTGTDPSTCLSLNEGAITQPAAVNNDAVMHVANADLASLGALTDLSTLTGGLLIGFDYYRATDPATLGYIISRGSQGVSGAGFHIYDQTNNSVRMDISPISFSVPCQATGMVDSAWNHVAFYLDASTSASLLYGTAYANGSGGPAISVAKSNLQTPLVTHGFTLFAKEITPAGTFSLPMAAGNRVRNLVIARFANNQNSHIARIVKDLIAYPYDLPWEMAEITDE